MLLQVDLAHQVRLGRPAEAVAIVEGAELVCLAALVLVAPASEGLAPQVVQDGGVGLGMAIAAAM